jgi:hypothetical protein
MIRIMSELPARVLGFEAIGHVNAADYENVVIPEFRAVVEDGEMLRVVYYLGPEFTGFSLGALLDDARVGLDFMRRIERVALVTDLDWVRRASGLFSALSPAPVRVFPSEELKGAVEWLSE